MSHTVGSAFQQLGKEIEVVVSGATATSENVTRLVVAEARNDFKAQLEQTRVESQRRAEEMKRQVDEVAQGLSNLTEQLNSFKLASVGQVQGSQGEFSAAVFLVLLTDSSTTSIRDDCRVNHALTAAPNSP